MDVQTIARLAELPVRKVRYVIDHRLMPGLRGRLQHHLAGQPRAFTDMEGYFIACAAWLLAGGVRRRTIIDVMAHLADLTWPASGPSLRGAGRPRAAFHAVYECADKPALLQIGDGVHIRIKVGATDTNWLVPRTWARLIDKYEPRVLVQLDLRRLRLQFSS